MAGDDAADAAASGVVAADAALAALSALASAGSLAGALAASAAGSTAELASSGADAAGSGADAGCGTPGQLVTLVFLDGTRQVAALKAVWDNNQVQELSQELPRITVYLPLARR